jgi:hypothetical protein
LILFDERSVIILHAMIVIDLSIFMVKKNCKSYKRICNIYKNQYNKFKHILKNNIISTIKNVEGKIFGGGFFILISSDIG